MAKKMLSILLALTMLLSLAACGGAPASTPASAPASQPASAPAALADPFGKYEPGIELSAVRYLPDGIKFAEGEAIDNNIWAKTYQNDLGVKVNYIWTTPSDQYNQKLNTYVASEELPDLMWVNAAQLKRLVEDGQLADLTQIYEEYKAPLTDKILNDDGGNALKSATFGGKLYGLPHMQSGIGSTHVLWLRTDWLKKLNLPEPKTMQDLLAISKAFKENDPDGNSKNDTFGLGVNKDLFGFYAALEGFFNGYHAYPNTWVTGADGKLTYGSTQPEMKTALTELQRMYKDGEIDLEFGVKDAGKVSEGVNSGKIGMYFGYFWNAGWMQDGKGQDPDMEWAAYPIPSIDGTAAKAQVPFATSWYTVVSADCKNPEAAIKLYNLVLEKNYGETAEPSVYNVAPDGTALFDYCYTYGEPPMKNLDAQALVSAALENKDTSKLNAEQMGYYTNCSNYLAGDNTFWGNYLMYGPTGSLSVINQYVKNNNKMDNAFFGAPTESMAEKNATLDKLQLETFTKIIAGNVSVDEFDKFVENWNKLGGDAITAEVNEWQAQR